jgi:hypothetical protein
MFLGAIPWYLWLTDDGCEGALSVLSGLAALFPFLNITPAEEYNEQRVKVSIRFFCSLFFSNLVNKTQYAWRMVIVNMYRHVFWAFYLNTSYLSMRASIEYSLSLIVRLPAPRPTHTHKTTHMYTREVH